jgi:hypothetical protein
VSQARITAIGVGAGFTGKMEAINRLARQLHLPAGSTATQSIQDRLQSSFGHLIQRGLIGRG